MNYQFSPEELKVLQECNRESFFQRSIPFGTTCGVATWFAIQKGFLSAAGKFGPTPKILAGITFGYFVGKLSYQTKCAEKIMQIPNSKLAEMLRRKKKGEFFESFTADNGISMAPFGSSTELYSDEALKPNSSLNLDTERPSSNTGLDDSFRPNLDTPEQNYNDNLPLEPPKSSVSYEELRRKNRDDYDRKIQNPFNRPLTQDDPPPLVIRQPERNEPQEPRGPKNKYGDVWNK